MNLDRVAAAAVAGVYGAAVVIFLPPSTHLHMLGGGALYFGAVAALARVLGRLDTPGMSILLVSAAGIAVLLMPNFPAMGGQHMACPSAFSVARRGR